MRCGSEQARAERDEKGIFGLGAGAWWVKESAVCLFLLVRALRELSHFRSDLGREEAKENIVFLVTLQ